MTVPANYATETVFCFFLYKKKCIKGKRCPALSSFRFNKIKPSNSPDKCFITSAKAYNLRNPAWKKKKE